MTDPASETNSADQSGNELFRREWDVPLHAHLVPLCLAVLMIALWLLFARGGGMESWAVSWDALQRGRVQVVLLHMFAHGSLLHLALNMLALLVLSGPLTSRFGNFPLAWVRYLYVFVGSGLAGAALFLFLTPNDDSSMLGASGAIFGLLGALARVHPATGELVAIRSSRTWSLIKLFFQNHIALFGLLAIVALLTGTSAIIAWQAHLGGLLFGFFVTPLYLPRGGGTADQES